MKDIGIGVVGLDGHGASVLAIDDDPGSRLTVRAICDPSEAILARQRAARPGIPLATERFGDLLEREDIQVIGAFMPDHLNHEYIREALRAGKHVVCDKPLGVSLEQTIEIVRQVRKSGRKLLVAQTCRFDSRFAAAKALLDSGDLGRPLFAEAHYVHDLRPVYDRTPWRYEVPQDFIYGGACHPVDLLRWFLGDVEEVFCYAGRSELHPGYAASGYPDNFLITLRFRSGAIGRALAAYGLVEPPLPMFGLSVFGSEGSFVNDRCVLEKLPNKPELQLTFRPDQARGRETWRYLRHFEECILGERKPLIDEVEGGKTIATCAAIAESVQTGRPIKVRNEDVERAADGADQATK